MSPNPLGNRDLMRAINRSTVLSMIKTHGPIARAEIARRVGLSPATITAIAAELIEQNLVIEKEAGGSSGGRPPILLALNPKGGCVIGIKLTEVSAIAALTDLEALVVAKQTIQLSGASPQAVVKDLASLVHSLAKAGSVEKKCLLGVGIGVAGIVAANRGLLRMSPYYGWHNVPLSEMLSAEIGAPVYLDNDVNTLTITEKWFGAGQDVDNFLTVTVGRGVGMGMVFNGQFYRGVNGGAGEFGHTVIDPEGPTCECGKRGCLEAYVGDPGLLRAAAAAYQAGELDQPVESVDLLVSLAGQGSPAACRILAQAGDVLGRGIANLINVLSPQKILISGEGTRLGQWLFGPMTAAVQAHVIPGLAQDTQIQIDPWGDDAWARGAAGLVLRELFESPVHREYGG
jgi:N-acetylglucosamine repressor